MKRSCLIAAVALLSSLTTRAVPLLQLDILNGIYVGGTVETTFATSDPFNLITLYNGLSPTGSFYVAAAIVPQVGVSSGSPTADFGSFTVNGTTYSYASGNMVYGNPPLSSLYPDLPSHGIYDTWYAEIGFSFNSANRAVRYNTADYPGGLVISSTGQMLYNQFAVDTSGLQSGYAVHFDFYDEIMRTGRSVNYSLNFAPFSHDAQSMTRQRTVYVPESSATLGLLAGAMLLLGGLRRRFALNRG